LHKGLGLWEGIDGHELYYGFKTFSLYGFMEYLQEMHRKTIFGTLLKIW
jgi:hypothetical protein